MKKVTRWVALDVHADSITAAIADQGVAPRYVGVIHNTPSAISKLVRKLSKGATLRVCYEAGPTGYAIYWQLTTLGIHCDVIAPSHIPRTPGRAVKTDKSDAMKLVHCYRNGDLRSVWVPDRDHEALRELVRYRAVTKKEEHRCRRRTVQFLMRHGHRKPQGLTSWRHPFMVWIQSIKFESIELTKVLADMIAECIHQTERLRRVELEIDEAIARAAPQTRALIEGLQALRGVATVVAATIVAEVGNFTRFKKPAQLMGYSGAVPSEHSSGDRVRRGAITKMGNSHLRRVLVEAACSYRQPPRMYQALKMRQRKADPSSCEIAWKAQHRLHRRFLRLTAIGKAKPKAFTAVARELLGFVWAIGTHIESKAA